MQKIKLRMRSWSPVLLLGLLAVAGCKEKNTFVPPPPPTVTVAAPQVQSVTRYAQYSGTTAAVKSVELRARVEGYLQSIHFDSGGLVKKGDLLFVIDPRPYQARLDEATAQLAMRRAEMRLAEATLKRKESAYKDDAVSEVEVIAARAEQSKAAATIDAARADIETARLQLSYTRIHAPISGRIGRHLVDVGNLVGAGDQTLLATLVSENPVYVYFNVNERDLLEYQQYERQQTPTNSNGHSKIDLGLSNEDDYPHPGHIDYVDNRVDAQTGTIQVRAVFENAAGSLLPGLFGRLRAPISVQKEALVVPEQAFGIDQQGYYLLVVNDQNQVEYRGVEVGSATAGLRVVQKGLVAGERVIVNGLQRVRPGATVNPQTAEQLAAAKQSQAG
ncbi:MAG: efflux transporter periplasmic adaptor subunit [Desulfuromonadales bacterium C00003094]|nr:MAG: efflux transporter periplasmic adaptor subunit [Desulfuromonadales bacterium C00003094]